MATSFSVPLKCEPVGVMEIEAPLVLERWTRDEPAVTDQVVELPPVDVRLIDIGYELLSGF